MPQNSRMSITGKNALTAALIALVLTITLAFLYSCMTLFMNFSTREDVNISEVVKYLGQSFVAFFQLIGICAGPVCFIFGFALLQRFRIKGNPDMNGTEEEE